MKIVDEILGEIEYCIENDEFRKLENEKIELKDNSHEKSDWNEVYKTINAFLNTDGGIIITGIKEDEKNRKFILTGFDHKNEPKTKAIISKYTDEKNNIVHLPNNVRFETRKLLNHDVLIIFVDALADDQKYVFYDQKAYKRIITGDHEISDLEKKSQLEYKAEVADSKEITIVANATLGDISIDKINDYIQLLNAEFKIHSLKSSAEEATTFLTDNGMLREMKPTILGILVCGKNPYSKLHWASEVNAYVASNNPDDIVQNKKIINGTVLELMEQSIAFVIRNIQTGISAENGGTKTFEYPQKLIRECVNNSLAHRDYSINQFVSINIQPGKHIQIRNPGRFKSRLLLENVDHEIPVRRIIANNPKANNPKLAKVLSSFNKWEGKGYGMANVVNACFDDKIDVPYYIFHSKDELSLYIPGGHLIDVTMETLFVSYSGYISSKLEGNEITEEQKRVMAYLYKSEKLNREDKYTILLTKDNNHLNAIQSLQDAGLIIRHPLSESINPIFIVDRNIFKKSFHSDLMKIFGNRYLDLDKDYKDVLAYIYERNNFSAQKYPSANDIGTHLWIKMGNVNKLSGFESYKRKIRLIVSKLEKSGNFLTRKMGKPNYVINYGVDKNIEVDKLF
ncbi:MAG: putative DNA binding domain-containing protein [Taibaiella sp.]|nr:putative DNA binding domain-containing protein [Taibaiella sp.]